MAIAADKRVFLNTAQVRPSDLTSKVVDSLAKQKDKVVLIKADQDVDYGTVMETMDNLRAAGVEDMGLITEKKVKVGGGN